MSSVLSRVNHGSLNTNLNQAIPGVLNKSPLALIPKQTSYLPTGSMIRDTDVDRLGQDISRSVGPTTEKIISKMSVGKFDELGAILTQIQSEADKLDPASLQKNGLLGWWQRHFSDVKQQLTMKMKTAEDVFGKLEEKISQHIAVHSEWITDFDNLYSENYDQYKKIQEVMIQAKMWETGLTTQLQNWPALDPNDPEATMKAQEKRDVEGVLNRLRRKIDSLIRLRVITESNAPKIRSQQNTSRSTISTLQDIVEQTIPLIKTEFSLFIQSLDAQKSIQLVDSAKSLANRTLVKSADAAKQSAIDSARSFNNPVILTDTLNHIRTCMIETVQEVGKIQKDAEVTRAADAKMLSETQKQYLNSLQQTGAV